MRNGLRLALAGAPALAHLSGALWLPGLRVLAVADLHLEKAASLTRRGAGPTPPYDTRATLMRLAEAIAELRPETVISLGDAFHDDAAAAALPAEERAMLADLADGRRWIWIAGNHDPAPPAGCAGESMAEWRTGPLVFRHHPQPGAVLGEAAGHLHPKKRTKPGGRCFVTDGRRIVLPAFGTYAGGLDIADPAIAGLFAGGFNALVIGRRQVFCLHGGGARENPAQGKTA